MEEFEEENISFDWEPLVKDPFAALVLFNEKCSELELIDCVKDLLEQGERVIVMLLAGARLPFHKVWELLGAGVDDVLQFQKKGLVGKMLIEKYRRWSIVEQYLNKELGKGILIGSSPIWLNTLRKIIEIACFSQMPLLILGESGTGKELVSRLVHELDGRKEKKDLVLLDCSSIVPELSGSEFFGHEKGAFTNAVVTRDGAFALADGGTLFLDEIGELPLRLQGELLRVIQEGTYKRVGSNIWKHTEFRLICATNRQLFEEVHHGRFREDLYYRLSSCVVRLPSLRERRMDIPELAHHFIGKALKTDTPPPFDDLLLRYIMLKDYPGNVRQLKHLIYRIAYRHSGDVPITLGHIPEIDRADYSLSDDEWQGNGIEETIRKAVGKGIGLKEIKRKIGNIAMNVAIDDTKGNLQEAARQLDVSDRLVQGYYSEKKRINHDNCPSD